MFCADRVLFHEVLPSFNFYICFDSSDLDMLIPHTLYNKLNISSKAIAYLRIGGVNLYLFVFVGGVLGRTPSVKKKKKKHLKTKTNKTNKQIIY